MIRNPKYKFIEWKLIIIYLILLAIGLITLSSVDNAEFNKQTIFSFISLFFGFFILLCGHGVNIVLGIMGGVIHGLRLNFLEWYRHCFEGGGRLFNPLRKVSR